MAIHGAGPFRPHLGFPDVPGAAPVPGAAAVMPLGSPPATWFPLGDGAVQPGLEAAESGASTAYPGATFDQAAPGTSPVSEGGHDALLRAGAQDDRGSWLPARDAMGSGEWRDGGFGPGQSMGLAGVTASPFDFPPPPVLSSDVEPGGWLAVMDAQGDHQLAFRYRPRTPVLDLKDKLRWLDENGGWSEIHRLICGVWGFETLTGQNPRVVGYMVGLLQLFCSCRIDADYFARTFMKMGQSMAPQGNQGYGGSTIPHVYRLFQRASQWFDLPLSWATDADRRRRGPPWTWFGPAGPIVARFPPPQMLPPEPTMPTDLIV